MNRFEAEYLPLFKEAYALLQNGVECGVWFLLFLAVFCGLWSLLPLGRWQEERRKFTESLKGTAQLAFIAFLTVAMTLFVAFGIYLLLSWIRTFLNL